MWSTVIGTLFLLSRVAHALRNITVDDDNASIVYGGYWGSRKDHTSNLYHGGSIRLSKCSSSNVTFTFTGVAVYYFSPKWPFKANSIVSIDSQPAVTVDLTDNSVPLSDQDRAQNASSPSAVVWSITGLSNDTHNILITRSDDSEGMAVVDGFIYTILDEANTLVTNPPTSDSSADDAVTSNTLGLPGSELPSTPSSLRIIIAVIGTTVPLSVISTVVTVLYVRNRRKKKQQAKSPENNISQTTVHGLERGTRSTNSSASRGKGKSRATNLYALGNYSEMTQPSSSNVRAEHRRRDDYTHRSHSHSRSQSHHSNSQRRPSDHRRPSDRGYHPNRTPPSARSSRQFPPSEPVPSSSRQSRHSVHSESETTLPSDNARHVPSIKTVFPSEN